LPLPRSALAWLLKKEWRELLVSRAWWIFLVLMGPLAGVSFISAVHTYAEASGLGGTSAGVGEAFSPLIGIWAPTFSACELAAAFLLPFVAIRLFAGDRQSGALKLELQHPTPAFTRIAAKALILMAGWCIALLAPAIGVALWKWYGGNVYVPELSTVVLGHLLNAGLTIALAGTAASMTEHPATAAIVTLAITVGSWIVNFIAAVHGGWWERAAGYTPTAMVAEFQHGLIRLDVLLIALALILAGLSLAAIWIRLGAAVRRRVKESILVAATAMALIFVCAAARRSWDLSENRMNSFSRADEQALLQIRGPLHIEVHLAPEDPRRVDLEHRTLSKLRRLLPGLRVEYFSTTSIGLFEQTSSHYGEIWYELGGRREMSRAVTPEGALETIYSLAGITPPESADSFLGHPLAVAPRGAALVFYFIWPVLIMSAGFFVQRRPL
jgi:ABC-2 type transport system permease protein